MTRSSAGGRLLSVRQAAEVLGLTSASVEALVGAGYLRPAEPGPGAGAAPDGTAEVHLALTDLKAFMARNAVSPGADELGPGPDLTGLRLPRDLSEVDADAQVLLDALDGRAEEMADRALSVFTQAIPAAAAWSDEQRTRFLEHARSRFEAILAIAGRGHDLDDDLVAELADVGGAAARAGTPLPEVLVTLRISRDLVLQTAVELAEARGRRWGLALALLLTRILPAIDRLTDAIATGYWAQVVADEEEGFAHYAAVVEHATEGVFEVDPDGVFQYANPALSVLLGAGSRGLVGRRADEVVAPVDPSQRLDDVIDPANLQGGWIELRARRADGLERILQVRVHVRQRRDGSVGYAGVVRDVTADRDLARQKDDFLALMTQELRSPVTTVLGLGITLDSYARELTPERVARIGRTIHQQAERIARLADDLFDVSRLETNTLLLAPRAVDLRTVVDAALGMLAATRGIEEVEVAVPPGMHVRVDARRAEQVLAHLVENALVHGAPPVRLEAVAADGAIELCVRDRGPGLPPGAEDVVFTRLHTSGDAPRYRDRASGLGLSLVRGLVEAMGGRVAYLRSAGPGATFVVRFPTPVAGR